MARLPLLLTLCGLVAAVGCREDEQIRRYTVPKQSTIDRLAKSDEEPAGPQRMLAAIILRPSQGWFVKLVGPEGAIDARSDEFTRFLKSLHFRDDATPEWSLPENWREEPGNQFRYATLAVPGEPPLEVSVSTLPRGEIDEVEYVLSNVNRWRGQLGLPGIAANELQRESRQVELDGAAATLVDLVGQMKKDSMSAAPFASRGPAAPLTPHAGSSPRLKYDVPAGWQEEPASGFRKASFRLAEGDASGEATVTDLDISAGDLLPNVNRWRGQIGAEPTTQREVDEQVVPIEVGADRAQPLEGQYIEMFGDEKATFAVIAKTAGKAWFIKLTGDKDLVERQRDNFKSFVHSLAIGEATGAADGN